MQFKSVDAKIHLDANFYLPNWDAKMSQAIDKV
jgi:hypothetical protein